jgi:hypothetical protein
LALLISAQYCTGTSPGKVDERSTTKSDSNALVFAMQSGRLVVRQH